MITVGFIGLGRMGKPMAINVLDAGFPLIVHDLRSDPVEELVGRGAKRGETLSDVGAADLIEVAVVDDAQVEAVVTGERGIFAGIRPGSVVAIHSTVLPSTIKRLAKIGERVGAHVIDAPVSGGETGARTKELCYMVGGDPAVIEICREVFKTSAAEIFHMGELGCGAAAKTIVQVVTCINMLAAHEAELLAEKSGLNFPRLQEMLHCSSGRSFVLDHWRERFKIAEDPMAVREQRTKVFQKSLVPARAMAEQLGVALAGAELVERMLPRIMGITDS